MNPKILSWKPGVGRNIASHGRVLIKRYLFSFPLNLFIRLNLFKLRLSMETYQTAGKTLIHCSSKEEVEQK